MTRHDLGISKYAKVLTDEERDFAAYCKKLTDLCGDGFLPLSLNIDLHVKLCAEYYLEIEKEKTTT